VTSVVIPAHDEQQVIGRLLSGLASPAAPDHPSDALDIVVVCNGCSDDTAAVAASFAGVKVMVTPIASKQGALRFGNEAAVGFPRVYVDADVEISREGVLALAAALDDPARLAVAPRRVIPRRSTTLPVRWYYDVWEALPNVGSGLFGRGVIAVSRAGYERIGTLPDLMSDDLAASGAFTDAERSVVDSAVVIVHPPRTWNDLVRRRTRVAIGTAQAYAGDTGLRTDSRTTRSDLRRLLRQRPSLAPRLVVFLVASLVARRRAAAAVRQGDYKTWLRDESSRQTR
jgi:glycosyltransferase involved in cell wall biosynthesis